MGNWRSERFRARQKTSQVEVISSVYDLDTPGKRRDFHQGAEGSKDSDTQLAEATSAGGYFKYSTQQYRNMSMAINSDSGKLKKPGPGRPRLDSQERSRILEATAALFLEKGYANANTIQIARRARTSKQTLYSLFPTKADLFAGVIGLHVDRLFARHGEFIGSAAAPEQTLNEMGYMLLSMFSGPQFLALYRIVVAEAHNFPDLARRLWTSYKERGYTLLAEYLKSRGIGGPHYRKSAAQFLSFVLGDFIVNALLNPDLKLSDRVIRLRVREAVRDFLQLHSGVR